MRCDVPCGTLAVQRIKDGIVAWVGRSWIQDHGQDARATVTVVGLRVVLRRPSARNVIARIWILPLIVFTKERPSWRR